MSQSPEHGPVRFLAISRACTGVVPGIGVAVGNRHNGRNHKGARGMEGKEERYQAALELSRLAVSEYHAARLAYRGRKINDAEFLAVRERMVMTQVTFDQAERDLKFSD